LFTWRSYQDQQTFVTGLRPFVASLQLSDRLLGGQPSALPEAERLLAALCEEALGAGGATLTLASDSGQRPAVIAYRSPHARARPAGRDDAASGYELTLQTAHGPAGVLRLEPKIDGSVYSAEEIDLARAAAERLIDTEAGERVVGILMGLLRHRLAEVKILGTRRERVILDDVLPRLRSALSRLEHANHAGTDPSEHVSLSRADRDLGVAALTEAQRELSNLLETAVPINPALERKGLARALRDAVEAELAGQFDRVDWRVDEALEKTGPPELVSGIAAEVAYYAVLEAVRNAAIHGRGGEHDRPLNLILTLRLGQGLWAIVEDDGVGLLLSRLLHVNPESAGRAAEPAAPQAIGGRGLLFHSTMLAVLGGYLSVLSRPQGGCRVEIWLPEAALRAPARLAAGLI
jgi:hypothetical protein